MKISDYFFTKCNDINWYNNFYQCGDTGEGSIFKCFGTNYRNLSSFEYYFKEFKKYIGIPRNLWDKKETTGQEIAKQYVVNMLDSLLYLSKRNSDNELVYELSSRGKDFEQMINLDFSEEERKLLLIIYLMNSAFKKQPRYFLKQSLSIWNFWEKAGLNKDKIFDNIRQFVLSEKDNKKVKEIFNYDIVWFLSFYSDESFLKLFNVSNIEEKNYLKEKTMRDYENSNKKNVHSWKYKSTNFQKPTLIDTLVILYLSKVINDCKILDYSFSEFYTELISSFSSMYSINKDKILNYIIENNDIFKVIFKNAISDEDDFTERYIPTYNPKTKEEIENLLTEKIDSTSQEGIEKLEVVRSVLKKIAKEQSKYLCALHDINSCNYFTSKEEHKNFLEIHHLIPREFSFIFDYTIEFVENYIPLCPRCHRMIHKAEDRERKNLINYLFNKRKLDLEKNHINVTIKDLYDFYKIDIENR